MHLYQCLAEGLSLLGMLDCQTQRALDHGDSAYPEDGAFIRQFGHQLRETFALDTTENIFQRHAHIIEKQLAGILPLLADFFQNAADPETRAVLGLQ